MKLKVEFIWGLYDGEIREMEAPSGFPKEGENITLSKQPEGFHGIYIYDSKIPWRGQEVVRVYHTEVRSGDEKKARMVPEVGFFDYPW